VNGKTLRAAGAQELSAEASANWAMDQDRFGPVVVLRLAAGAKEPVRITLQ
jgi:hypothetical protein